MYAAVSEMISGDPDVPRQYLGVMVSSTFRDLREHRAALMKAIEGQGLHAVAMEQDAALPDGTVVDASLRKVRDASAYVGIISHLYGQIPESADNPERLSVTELEFREARRLGRSILIFIMGPNHAVVPVAVERDPEKIRKLDAFREEVKRVTADSPVHRVYREFNDLADFSVAATQSLAELGRHLDARSVPITGSRAPSPARHDGIPAAPALYAEPRYIGSHTFVGRAAQLTTLSDWAAPAEPHTVLVFEAIGGTGKSMLTWEWTTRHATGVRGDWAGRFWYSFYEKGAVMADFCRRALAYLTGEPVAHFARKAQRELSELLLRQLQARPWLLVLDGLERVLVAYHRYDAAQLPDEQADRTDDKGDPADDKRGPCDAIRPEDDDLLRQLAGVAPSKILITSRLVPRILLNKSHQPIPGVLHERLPGLRPADAEALLRSCGIHGDPEIIRTYLQRHCDCHPLVIGIVAGLVSDYLHARGQFNTWAADPDHGGRLDLAELDLVSKRNHILHAALAALSDTSHQLLSTLALLPGAVDYNALSAFNPHLPPEPEAVPEPARPEDNRGWQYLSEEERQAARARYAGKAEHYAEYQRAHRAWRASPEVVAAPRNLSCTVRDLERRGLLQYDRQADRYDLHPVVRGVAAGVLRAEDRERLGQQVLDHFTTQAHNPYKEAESLDDLRNALTVVRTLLRMGRTQQAWDAYRGEMAEALSNLEAHAEVLSLLRPFFAHGWTLPLVNLPDGQITYLARCVAGALSGIGEPGQATTVHGFALDTELKRKNWANVRTDLTNLAAVLDQQNRLAQSERCLDLARKLTELTNDPEDRFMARLATFSRWAEAGRVADAERIWGSLRHLLGRDLSRVRYRPGTAELRYAWFQLDRGTLTEEYLVCAERLASSGRNRLNVRSLHALRGRWLLQQGEWARASDSFTEAVRMAREMGIADPWSETELALARLRLGQLPEPVQEAERLTGLRQRAGLPLAELWQAIGRIERATEHALAAYRYAWADGKPYVRRYQLERAALLLSTLGAAIPTLPAYNPTVDPKLPWEDKVAAAIEKLRRGPNI